MLVFKFEKEKLSLCDCSYMYVYQLCLRLLGLLEKVEIIRHAWIVFKWKFLVIYNPFKLANY